MATSEEYDAKAELYKHCKFIFEVRANLVNELKLAAMLPQERRRPEWSITRDRRLLEFSKSNGIESCKLLEWLCEQPIDHIEAKWTASAQRQPV